MADVPIDKRFRGSVRLVTLLLWRLAKSTDLEEGFAEARDRGWLSEESESFVRRCMDIDAQLEQGQYRTADITLEMVNELQLCAMRLNTADPA